nr:hypothetical protein Iba_chr05cCG9140 [Ipomoea batatas]
MTPLSVTYTFLPHVNSTPSIPLPGRHSCPLDWSPNSYFIPASKRRRLASTSGPASILQQAAAPQLRPFTPSRLQLGATSLTPLRLSDSPTSSYPQQVRLRRPPPTGNLHPPATCNLRRPGLSGDFKPST